MPQQENILYSTILLGFSFQEDQKLHDQCPVIIKHLKDPNSLRFTKGI